MPEIPNVITQEEITVEWGNAIRDRTVQRYANSTERNTETPSPDDGDLSYLESTGDVAVYHSGAWRNLLPAGSVLPFAGTSVPAGFLLCNGQTVSRTTYAALFAAIGTAFGAGDGSTTFSVPDLRGRFPLGVAASGTGDTLGETGGAIDHTHTGPSHSHTGPSHTHTLPANTANQNLAHTHSLGGETDAGGSHSHTASTASHTSIQRAAGTSDFRAFVSGDTGHSHTVNAGGSHSHGLPANTGTTSSSTNHAHDIGGSTGSGGTDSTGAGGTGATGTANPPFLALHFIIKH